MTEEIKKQPSEEEKGYISIDDFHKVEARVGKVLVAELVPDSDKLIRFELDFGEGAPRQILSAIRQWYPEPEKLVGKMMLFCVNLAPRKLRGLESHGMLMAIDGADGTPMFLVPDGDAHPGSRVH